MQIKREKKNFRSLKLLAFSLVGFFSLALLLLYQQKGFDSFPRVQKLVALVSRERAEIMFQARGEKITLDIKHKDYMKLEHKRQQALEEGLLFVDDNDWVPAKIRHGDETYKARIRLKGDWTDHLVGDQWSFRVKLTGSKTLFGLKVFSLQHPARRNYVGEWVWLRLLKSKGIATPYFDYLTLVVNGKNWGAYNIEGHFDKYLVEGAERRNGPIVRFQDDRLWDRNHRFITPGQGGGLNQGDPEWKVREYTQARIEGYKESQWQESVVGKEQLETAVALLEGFRREELQPEEVFDLPKMAIYLAISDLMGAFHGDDWINLRFYYNPVTSRLEPIGFDGGAGVGIKNLSIERQMNWAALSPLFRSERFLRLYAVELANLSDSGFLESFMAEIEEELHGRLGLVYQSSLGYTFDPAPIYKNRELIRTAMRPGQPLYAHHSTRGSGVLEVATTQPFPLEVVAWRGEKGPFQDLEQPLLLQHKEEKRFLAYQEISLVADQNVEELKVRLIGSNHQVIVPVLERRAPFRMEVADDPIRRKANADSFSFVGVDHTTQTVKIRSGNWELKETLVTPRGYRVVAEPGTRIDLMENGHIILRGPAHFIGTKEQPIEIVSTQKRGYGLLVTQAIEASLFEYVRFSGLGAPESNGSVLTGSVTFFESPVTMRHCEFVDSRAEDGLNMVQSPYTLDSCLFHGMRSDAFDADFSDGVIIATRFINCANDGVDISGSRLKMVQVYLDQIGDKAISAGERSSIAANDLVVRRSALAITSKDHSSISLRDSKIDESTVAFVAFQKKPEFGPASIVADRVSVAGVAHLHMVEKGSRVLLDNKIQTVSEAPVEERLYGNEFGVNSKDTNPLKKEP